LFKEKKPDKPGLVVPVKNVEALAEALQTLVRDKPKRLTYGAAAATFARENFNQKEFIRLVLEDKEKLLSEKDCASVGDE